MLHEFSVRNFYSFADEAAVSFCVGEHAPDNTLFADTPSGQRISKMLTVIGANASGKTNLLKGLAFLRWFMLASFRTLDPKDKIPVDEFAFTEAASAGMAFRLTFELESGVYRYTLEIKENRVTLERLERMVNRNFGYLFKREWDAAAKTTVIREQNLGFDVDVVQKLVRDNCSLLSVLRQTENKALEPVFSYLADFRSNVDRMGRRTHYIADVERVFDAAAYFYQHPDYRTTAEHLLAGKLDLGLSGIEIVKRKIPTAENKDSDVAFVPYGVHRVNDKDYKLPLLSESSGTQNSFVLLHLLLPILQTGGMAVIDEFEVNLHPQMITPILDLFLDPETNPKNAQLFFSTHSIEVLRKLDKTQVLLVEKDDQCRSHACRLDAIKGVRRDVDLYAKYMSGAFGAVPRV